MASGAEVAFARWPLRSAQSPSAMLLRRKVVVPAGGGGRGLQIIRLLLPYRVKRLVPGGQHLVDVVVCKQTMRARRGSS